MREALRRDVLPITAAVELQTECRALSWHPAWTPHLTAWLAQEADPKAIMAVTGQHFANRLHPEPGAPAAAVHTQGALAGFLTTDLHWVSVPSCPACEVRAIAELRQQSPKLPVL